jgi:hypothetical protein
MRCEPLQIDHNTQTNEQNRQVSGFRRIRRYARSHQRSDIMWTQESKMTWRLTGAEPKAVIYERRSA